jgi:hypothetical protein
MVKTLALVAALAVSVSGFSQRPTQGVTPPTDPPATVAPATDAPTAPATDAPTDPATEAPTNPPTDPATDPPTVPPTEDPLTRVWAVSFSEFARTGTCDATPLVAALTCYTAGGRSYRFGCRVGSTAVLTDVCEEGCTNCNNAWSNEGEETNTCYDDGSALFQYSCSAPEIEQPVIPTMPVPLVPIVPDDPTQGPVEETRLTCSQLGWLPDAGSTQVCAASRVDPNAPSQCSGLTNFYSANSMCKAIGARLCTSAELSNDEAVGTGCKYDTARIWTSTTCDNGKGRITQAGARKGLREDPVDCTTATAREAAVRCCADVTTSGTTPIGAPDINGYPSGYGPASTLEYRVSDGGCGTSPEIRSSNCWVDPNGVANRFACAANENLVWYQSCGTDASCSPDSCSGDWATDTEKIGDCYSSASFFYQYQCSL